MSHGTEVHCHVPIRVRLIGRPDPEMLNREVAAAARRRLREAARHLTVEAAYSVTFDWQGTTLPEHTVAAIESTVVSAVDDMVTEVTREGHARDAERPGEPVDPDRDLAPLDGYLIPSYAGGGRKTTIPAQRQYHPQRDLTGGGYVEVVGRVDPKWTDADWTDVLFGAAEDAGYRTRAGEVVGLLFSDPAGGYLVQQMLVESVAPRRARRLDAGRIGGLWRFEATVDGQLNRVAARISVTSTVWVRGLGDTSSAQARAAIRVGRFTEQARARLAQVRAKIVEEQGEAAYAELEHATLQRIAEEPEEAGVRSYLDLVVDEEPLLLSLSTPSDMPAGQLMPILAYRQIVPDTGRAVDTKTFPATEDGEKPVCQPFEGEPPLSALGEDGERLRRLIAEIAGRLSIQVCEYAGTFAINAAAALGARASVSNTLDLLRRVAAVTPLLSELRDLIWAVYRRSLPGNPAAWSLHFLAEFTPTARNSVAVLFGTACKVLLLDMLARSAEQIRARKAKLDAYADLFEKVLLPRLHRNGDLRKLRERLRSGETVPYTERVHDETGEASPYPANRGWQEARRGLADALAPQPDQPLPPWGSLVPSMDGPRISDGVRTWSAREIEHEIVTGRALLESVDPLVKQLLDLEDVLGRFGDPRAGVRATLESLLDEMLAKNAEQREKTSGEWTYAFRLAKIVEDPAAPTVHGTGYALTGVHLLAHEAIESAFATSDLYTKGLEYLFGSEQGRKTFWAVLELPALVLLSVACPPLGAAAGVLAAGYHLHEAYEHKEAYQALLDPEKILSYAEIEGELFAARLALALAIIPEAGTILRGGARFGGRLAGKGLSEAVADTGRAMAAGITSQTIAALEKDLAVEFVKHMLTAELVQRISELVLAPVVARIEREAVVSGPTGGSETLLRVLQQIDREP